MTGTAVTVEQLRRMLERGELPDDTTSLEAGANRCAVG